MARESLRWLAGKGSFWPLNIVVWVVVAAASVPTYLVVYPTPAAAMLTAPLQIALALAFTGLMRAVYLRPEIGEPFQLKTAVVLVVLSFVAATIQAVCLHVFLLWRDWMTPLVDPWVVFSVRWKMLWMLYMGWSFGYFWLRAETGVRKEQERASRAENQARNLELQLLRSHLDPHFLFNGLNEISAEIPSNPTAAENMVLDLADYLRYSLDHRNQAITTVDEETHAMREYLRIEESRRDRKFAVRFEVDDTLLPRRLPFFILQPLVENAVKHAGENDGKPRIEVRVHLSGGGRLCLEVRNTGTIPPKRTDGVGLSTLSRRLQLHYPGRHHFELVEKGGMVQAQVMLEGEPCFA